MLFELALQLIDGVGPVTARNLVSVFGNAEAVFTAPVSQLRQVAGVSPKVIKEIRARTVFDRAEQECRFMEKHKVCAISFTDPDYPRQLRFCEDSPPLLFYRGSVPLTAPRMVAIVGTRAVGEYGSSVCAAIIRELAPYQPVIVSGLALGTDTVAHRTALECGIPTIATLAHGLDRVYPSQNRKLAAAIEENGALITELLSGTQPDRENFPKRNRIVAGLSQATIVIESGTKGGSMITARLAFDYNRDVFAVPGRLTDQSYSGNNKLIAANQAAMFLSVEDLVKQLGWDGPKPQPVQRSMFNELSETGKQLVGYLAERQLGQLDDMSLDLQLTISRLNAELMDLELKGLVRAYPGKKFSLLAF
ncbi:MAG: DNA-processing protein DprA [Bacteroidota bacterium]